MLFRFFVLMLLSISWLYALSDDTLLHRAKINLTSSNKSEVFRAYNDYKHLYLRALVNQKDSLRYKALQGIVTSGHKLHIDVKQYEAELKKRASLQPKNKKKSSYTNKKNKKKIYTTPSITLKKVSWHGDTLVLSFNKKLTHKQLNYFTLYDTKHHVYKYVFEIHASLLKKSYTLRKKNIDRIKIAQFTPSTLRVVIQNRKKLVLHYNYTNTQLNIIFGSKNKRIAAPTHYKKVRHKRVVIDAGHGGKDPGASGYRGYREKVVVLQIAKELAKILKQRGYEVYMTRSRDVFIKLRKRTQFANAKKADLFISIHANAIGGKSAKKAQGIECYFLDKSRSNRAKKVAAQENSADMSEMDYYGKEIFLSTLNSHNIVASNKLAIDLQRSTLASLRKHYKNVVDAGVRPAPFWVLVGAQMPSVLVEVGFITHPLEAKRLVNRHYQKKMAEGLANGVERYFINN